MKSIYENTFDVIDADENLKAETVQKLLCVKNNLRPSKKPDTPSRAGGQKKRKLIWIISAASFAAVLIFCGIFFPLSGLFGGNTGDYTKDGKLIPQYIGMKAGMTSIAAETPRSGTAARLAAYIADDDEDGDSAGEPYDDFPIDEQGAFIAYTTVDFFVTVFLNNPDNFEILSFTLNGKHYQSYEFQPGSTGQTIILKCKAEPEEGLFYYTIDAIKYVEGTAIKDVRIKGSKTIQISVLEKDWQETFGLSYTLMSGGREYSVSAGNITNGDVHIPRFYNDKPVTEIAEDGFCSKYGRIVSLNIVTIPGSVRVIRKNAFSDSGIMSITLSEGLEMIEDDVFRSNRMTEIVIPASVKSIGNGNFANCGWIDSFTVCEDNEHYKSIDGVLYTKDGTTLVKFPSLKKGAYVILSGVTRIESNAFGDAGQLTSLTIPEGVVTIGDWAFNGAYKLTSVVFPQSATEIGRYALDFITLRTITLLRPSSMGITKLLGIGGYGGEFVFADIYVPDAASVTAYRAASNWSYFASYIKTR